APASEPKGAGPAKADPVPVLAGAATLPEEGDPLLKPISSGIHSAAAGGEENAAPAQAPRAGGPGTVSALPPTAASEPKNAGPARVDGTPVGYGNMNPAPEGARDAEGTRKKKDDASARNEGQAEPPAMQAADGNRGVAERPAAPRPVAPASDPGVVRFEENAFVITRKSDTSVEVTLAPPGVGKLEIEVVLEKGVVNARITAADSAGREAIARSLPQIVEALARDGMNVGGFTVSLKERRDRPEDAPGRGPSRVPDARLLSAVAPSASASAVSAGLVDIFV
ncbi:MAG: flagellar hook-length control protein FliK, partial [Desulfobacteria bacterium]